MKNKGERLIVFFGKLYKRLTTKEIGFVDVIIICFTAISLMIINATSAPTIAMLLWRWVFMLPVLCITALISNNYETINEKITYAYVIITSNLEYADKKRALSNHLNLITSSWRKYYRKYEKIVNGNNKFSKKTALLYDLAYEIVNGKVTFPQIIYIMAYSFYSIIVSANIFLIDGPYDIMINIGFITFLRYWGADMKGLADLLGDFLGALDSNKTQLETEQSLIELQNKIKNDSYAAFILTEGEIIEPYQGIKIKANGTTLSKNEIDLEDAKELSSGLGNIIEKATEDKAHINGQIVINQ